MKLSLKPILAMVSLLVGTIGAGLTCSCCTPLPDPVQRAIDKIPTGTSRPEALRVLADAECHVECWYDDAVVDLFFYGSCDPEEAKVVIMGSQPVSGELQVYQIGTFEYYALRQAFGWCLEEQLPGED